LVKTIKIYFSDSEWSEEIEPKLVEKCNSKGCSIQQYVKDLLRSDLIKKEEKPKEVIAKIE
jgi:predicted transcriptional regulator